MGPRISSGRKDLVAAVIEARPAGAYHHVVLWLLGLLLGLSLIKFGTPVIFSGKLPPPSDFTEVYYFNDWPIQWGWLLVAVIGLMTLPICDRPHGVPRWLLLSPLVWAFWQWVSATRSIQPLLSILTAIHLSVVVVFFFLGLMATRGVSGSKIVWVGIGLGMCLVISSGLRQHFGGLEETREFYQKLSKGEEPPEVQAAFERPEVKRIWQSPLFQIKVNSKRIYGTLFYPNTLAGVILLLTPGLLAAIWMGLREASSIGRVLLTGLIVAGAAGCLLWSGSKAGWLIAFFQIGVLLFQSSIPVRWRRPLVIAIVVMGLGGLLVRNLSYFERGATSVSARKDYWVAAGETFLANPVMGSGPGTFGESYRARKAAASEMARLAHNDFIQQASDSGAVGFLSYLVFVGGGLWWVFRKTTAPKPLIYRLVLLGILGWEVQSFTEFGLYIPAIAWPAFFFLGALCRESAIQVDSIPRVS